MKKNGLLRAVCALSMMALLLAACSGGEEVTAADSAETAGTEELQAGIEQTVEEAGEGMADPEFEIDDYELRIGVCRDLTSTGLLHLMEKSAAGNAVGHYQFIMEDDQAALSAGMIDGDLDIALLPADRATALYNRTNAGVAAVEINTLGNLSCVSAADGINGVKDLKGKTVLLTGQGAMEEYAIRYLLEQYDVTDCNLIFHADAEEIVTLLEENPDQIAILSEPLATSIVMQNDRLNVRFFLSDEWDALNGMTRMIQGVTVVRREILEEHPSAVAVFLDEHALSVRDSGYDLDQTAELLVKQGIVTDAETAREAMPRLGTAWITGTDMETVLKGYLQVLYDADHTLIGGTFPTNDFYFDILGK